MDKLGRAVEVYRKSGIISLVNETYSFLRNRIRSVYFHIIRPATPISSRETEYNGIRTRPYRVIDPFLPIELPANCGGHELPQNYEAGLSDALRKYVNEGDSIIVIGGGLGVTASIAAEATGRDGNVICYEGAANMVEHAEETIKLNQFKDNIEIEHTIVSEPRALGGKSKGADFVQASDLPECNVLEMDCEGAEEVILSNLSIRPRIIIIETHNNKNLIKTKLKKMGYDIVSERIAEEGPHKKVCINKRVYVLTAEYSK